MTDDLSTTQGIVALAAAGVAVFAFVLAVVLAIKLRGVRRAQAAVLGGHERHDLVAHSERLQSGFVDLRDWVEDSLRHLDERITRAELRIDGCVAYRGLVRYDAYGEMSGRQSSSVALLDVSRSGVIISSILHRDQARVYVKQVRQGESEHELSPEELEAIETALAPARA